MYYVHNKPLSGVVYVLMTVNSKNNKPVMISD